MVGPCSALGAPEGLLVEEQPLLVSVGSNLFGFELRIGPSKSLRVCGISCCPHSEIRHEYNAHNILKNTKGLNSGGTAPQLNYDTDPGNDLPGPENVRASVQEPPPGRLPWPWPSLSGSVSLSIKGT